MLRLIVLGFALFGSVPAGDTVAASSADVLIGAGVHQEEVAGNLEAAIASYRKALATAGISREQAARAQFRIGACYERLGAAEARKAYELVLQQYPDQVEMAKQARARLAAMSASAAGRPAATALRQLWDGKGQGLIWGVSPDGRFLAVLDGECDI
jgi:tetratricopeptide (TPR) repeat protein